MTPEQTQEILQLITALWPRNPITADTVDAWASALVPVNADIARQAVIDHSRGTNGNWPPSVAVITAAMRSAQRDIRPADQILETINLNNEYAARDRDDARQRIDRCSHRVGTFDWLKTLDEARNQLCEEYDHTHIPTQLVAKRACDIIESNV